MNREIMVITNVLNALLEKTSEPRDDLVPEMEKARAAMERMLSERDVLECLIHDISNLGDERVAGLFAHYEVKHLEDDAFRKKYARIQEAIRKKHAEVRDDVHEDEHQ